MLPSVDPFPDLPRILEWEISLALLVLGWSLWSLRSRFSGRARGPLGARSRRTRAALVGLGFALAAASFTYAMPNLPAPEPSDRSGPQRLRGAEREVRDQGARSSPSPGASGAEAGPPSVHAAPGPQERGGEGDRTQLAGTFGLQAGSDDRRRPSQTETPAPATPATPATPTPEPTPLPTASPSSQPSPASTP